MRNNITGAKKGSESKVNTAGMSQYAERILNEIAKAISKNFAEFKCMIQGFRI